MSAGTHPARGALRRVLPNAAFVAGLVGAAAVAIAVDDVGGATPRHLSDILAQSPVGADLPPIARPRPSAPRDREAAERAWQYFATNTRTETGWVDSVAGFPSTTMWDLASYLLAIAAAESLGVVTREEAIARARAALAMLGSVALFEGKLPNKVYSTLTVGMTDYTNAAIDGGVGWSAIDLGRLMIAFSVLRNRFAELGPEIRRVQGRFDLGVVARDGVMIGARRNADGSVERVQEGRIGYEEYAARGLGLVGIDVAEALRVDDTMRMVEVLGTPILTDRRTRATSGAAAYTLSEPMILTAIELGLSGPTAELALRLYAAQRARSLSTGVLTALSEDHVDRGPRFVYATIIGDGVPFAVLAEDGSRHDALRAFSTKAAFGWAAIVDDAHAERLRTAAQALGAGAGRGFWAGRYEIDGTINRTSALNTHAVILEALDYAINGPALGR